MVKSNTWQHRKADTIEERFGLLDNVNSVRYRKQPVLEEGVGEPVKRPLTAMGLTCGIGSMLVGAQKLGFQVLGNVEWRDYYRYRPAGRVSTFVDNFKGAFQVRGSRDIPPELQPGAIDFAAGHPECGRYSNLSFSVSIGSYQEGRGTDVSDLPLFLKLVAMFRPRFFLMDDLPASFGPLPMQTYVDMLPDYDLFPEWISNWGYGNIQKYRNRMFIVGALKSERFTFWPGEATHTRVLKDDIFDLIGFDDLDDLKNHATVELDYHPGRYVNMRSYGDRPSWRDLRDTNEDLKTNLKYFSPTGEEKIRPGTRSPDWDGFCPVLSGGFNPLHPIRKLPLSIRERARIQGFPDDFVFHHDEAGPDRPIWEPYSSDGQRGIKQTGKAMPLQFCTYVADQVKHHIEKKPFKTSRARVAKPNDLVSEAKMEFCRLTGYARQDEACKACWLRATCPIYAANNQVQG